MVELRYEIIKYPNETLRYFNEKFSGTWFAEENRYMVMLNILISKVKIKKIYI